MYCQVVILSPALSFEIKGKQRNNGAFVSPTMLYSIKFVYIMREFMLAMTSKIWFVRFFSSQHYCKVITNIIFENVSQIRTKICKIRSFICKVNLNFLRSLRHFDCDTTFVVIVSFLNERLHGFNIICNGRVKTRFQIVESHWPSRFSGSGKKFVKELSVLTGNSCADALETNSVLSSSRSGIWNFEGMDPVIVQ